MFRTSGKCIGSLAADLGVAYETPRKWSKQHDVDIVRGAWATAKGKKASASTARDCLIRPPEGVLGDCTNRDS